MSAAEPQIPAGDNPGSGEFIRFTIKELLAQQSGKLDFIASRLEEMSRTKAESTAVADLDRRVLHFEKQEVTNAELVSDFKAYKVKVDHLEQSSASAAAVEQFKRRSLWGLATGAFGAVTASITLIATVVKITHHGG